jgi:peptidyl-prolyl cis-trans isomerase B (cyclophilin B)
MIPAVHRHSVAPRALLVLGMSLVIAACSTGGGATSGGDTTAAPSDGSGGSAATACPTSQPAALPAGETRTVTIETDKGTIAIKIEGDLSPIAAGNFVALAECGFYDGVAFHRVVPDFVIQGGDGQFAKRSTFDPNRAGTGGPGYEIQDEPVTATYGRGTVAMARTSQPNSVGSQFFIVLDDAARTSLASANTYQIIGTVSSGMDAVDAIADAADAEIPSSPVFMTKVSVSNP